MNKNLTLIWERKLIIINNNCPNDTYKKTRYYYTNEFRFRSPQQCTNENNEEKNHTVLKTNDKYGRRESEETVWWLGHEEHSPSMAIHTKYETNASATGKHIKTKICTFRWHWQNEKIHKKITIYSKNQRSMRLGDKRHRYHLRTAYQRPDKRTW